jgi:hypothetical protein
MADSGCLIRWTLGANCPCYTHRERAALEWTEAVALIEERARARRHRADEALREWKLRFRRLLTKIERPPIAAEKLLRGRLWPS